MTPDPMDAEFDTVAEWTAEAALALGRDHYVPAGCRGSGSPAALDWLLDRLDLDPGDRPCSTSAPASAARPRTRPSVARCGRCCSSPRPGRAGRPAGCSTCRRAGRRDRAAGARRGAGAAVVPRRAVHDRRRRPALLRELRRVLAPGGRGGLLVFVADPPASRGRAGRQRRSRPGPTCRTPLDAGRPRAVLDEIAQSELAAEPEDWVRRADAVEAEVERRHGHDAGLGRGRGGVGRGGPADRRRDGRRPPARRARRRDAAELSPALSARRCTRPSAAATEVPVRVHTCSRKSDSTWLTTTRRPAPSAPCTAPAVCGCIGWAWRQWQATSTPSSSSDSSTRRTSSVRSGQ